jgi:dCMP deaminase
MKKKISNKAERNTIDYLDNVIIKGIDGYPSIPHFVEKNMRISKHEYYLSIAKAVAGRGTCIRRNYGAVIVKNDCIGSTGYTGSSRGMINCCDKGTCIRNDLGCKQGEGYEKCCSVHGEMNAIIHGDFNRMQDSFLYLVGKEVDIDVLTDNIPPCYLCKKMIINAGISKVITTNNDGDIKEHIVKDWVNAPVNRNCFDNIKD